MDNSSRNDGIDEPISVVEFKIQYDPFDLDVAPMSNVSIPFAKL